jgi:group I intron endonuclease
MGYIYKITHKESGKSYIGQTVQDLEERWRSHLKRKSNCRYLSYALKKYGKDAFDFKLICICFDEDLDKFEQDYMKKYNTMVPNGFNLREGGNSGKQNEETKKKISTTLKDKFAKLEIIPKNGWLGKVMTQEHKDKIKKGMIGMPKKSEATKQKLREYKTKYRVLQYTLSGELVNTYESGVDAAKHINSTKSHISSACRGKRKTLQGFVWKYMDRMTNEILVFENNIKL